MPGKPKKPCMSPGCPELTTDKFCEKHKDQVWKTVDNQRGTAAQRGYGHQWRKAREGFLRKHPLCTHCHERSILTAATVVDHIVPHKGDKQVFWDKNNWQPLCESCHNIKTAKEDGGHWSAGKRR